MFEFVPEIPPDKREVILGKLSEIQRDHDVRVLFAIESGSRAWGFPSPDSDFDVRFVYAHPEDWYLSLYPGRDVIETPLIDDWDVNGWDIRKALGLLLKPNPVLLEWMSSPIRYIWDEAACDRLTGFAQDVVRPERCIPLYFHLAKNTWNRNIEGESEVNLKKYFYVLRPVLAMRWVRMNPDRLPPMNFQALVAGVKIEDALQHLIAGLLQQKARTSEIGSGERIAELDALILSELEWAEQITIENDGLQDQRLVAADQLFRELVRPSR